GPHPDRSTARRRPAHPTGSVRQFSRRCAYTGRSAGSSRRARTPPTHCDPGIAGRRPPFRVRT
ncbi:MAG: hypothetical protein COS57_08170, partial [Syntrophobacterales bacterium CG03_land_8_20_14_0_80_58_14]